MSRICPQGSPLSLCQLDKLDPSALAKFPANSSEPLAGRVLHDGVSVMIFHSCGTWEGHGLKKSELKGP